MKLYVKGYSEDVHLVEYEMYIDSIPIRSMTKIDDHWFWASEEENPLELPDQPFDMRNVSEGDGLLIDEEEFEEAWRIARTHGQPHQYKMVKTLLEK